MILKRGACRSRIVIMKMKIGELASLAGCQPVTIRFYEKKGLLKKPERSSANYRFYDAHDVERLRFILHCRRHGFTLEDIRRLLAIKDNGGACATVHAMLAACLEKVRNQLESLVNLQAELEKLQAAGECGNSGSCSILDALSAPDQCFFCAELADGKKHPAEKLIQ